MTFGPFPSIHRVTATEWNEFVSAFSAEIVRATVAETALGARATSLETFKTTVSGVIPVSSTTVSLHFDASALTSDVLLDAPGMYVGQLGVWQGSQNTKFFIVSLNQLFQGCKIKQFYMVMSGANWASLPSTQNVFTLVKYDPVSGTETTVDTFTDSAANVGAYNSRRTVGHVLSSPITTEPDKSYYLKVSGAVGGSDGEIIRTMTFVELVVVVSG